MLDPSALEVFEEEVQSKQRIPNGDNGSSEDDADQLEISKLKVRENPVRQDGKEVKVTKRTSRTTRHVTDSGVFKDAIAPPFASMPYTKSIQIEEGDVDSEGEDGDGPEEEVSRRRRRDSEPERGLARSPESPRYEYESRTEGSRGRRSKSRREILPEADRNDEFFFNGQRMRIGPKHKPGKIQGGKKFLKKVQHELEEQRNEWKSEVERMIQGSEKLQTLPKNSQTGGSNSFVDTSGPEPVYKAFFDVSEFPPSSISVSIDKLQNKVVVQANQASRAGTLNKSFTQKVQLPRFADEHRLTSKLSKKGILKVEVPLMYYFEKGGEKDKKAKSFINEVKTNPRSGQQNLEILVNTDPDIRAKDLHVQADGDKLVIFADYISSKSGRKKQKLIKQYTLPPLADVDHIRSRLGKDGRLAINVPLRRVDTSIRDSAGSPNVRTIKHEVTKQYNGAVPSSYHNMRYQTLEHQPMRSVHHQIRSSRTMPSHYKSEPILYELKPRVRELDDAPAMVVEHKKVVKRKVRRN